MKAFMDRERNILPFYDSFLDLQKQTIGHLNYKIYITKKLYYEFPGYNFKDNTIDNIISEIFPEPEMRNHIYDLFASFLSPEIPNSIIYFFVGRNSSGKSLIMKLINLVFGKNIFTRDFFCEEFDPAIINNYHPLNIEEFIKLFDGKKVVYFDNVVDHRITNTIYYLLNRQKSIYYFNSYNFK